MEYHVTDIRLNPPIAEFSVFVRKAQNDPPWLACVQRYLLNLSYKEWRGNVFWTGGLKIVRSCQRPFLECTFLGAGHTANLSW